MAVRLQESEIQKVLNLAKQGYNVTDISFYTKYDSTTVRKYCQLHGYTFERKCYSNLDFFDNIDTEDKAYWLGVLYTDGSVFEKDHRVNLTLKDKSHVEKFASIFNAEVKLSNAQSCCYILDKHLTKTLLDKGVFPRRSQLNCLTETPSYIPGNLMHHFIRGVLDGDGCVSISKRSYGRYLRVSFAGNYYFLEWLRNFVVLNYKLPIPSITSLQKSLTCLLPWNGSYAIRLMHCLYDDATVYLERKFNVFINYKRDSIFQNEQNKILNQVLL